MVTPFRRPRGTRTWSGVAALALGLLAAGLVIAVAGPSPGLARPTFLSEFNAEYGTAATRINACSVCHVAENVFDRNPYGLDLAANGIVFSAIEAWDSDGDGWSNLAEIEARTFPGIASDHPVDAECNGLQATIVGTPGDDILFGTSGDDVIVGRGGDDHIYGRKGDDTICGKSGKDRIYPGGGADYVDGGAGARDWVNYSGSGSAVVVSLRDGVATGQGGDRLIRIENIVGSQYADDLTGDGNTNRIKAGSGPDTVRGKAGDDLLWGKAGRDDLRG
ncbi:MAG: calcium-binding protein, partial [Acidimicrobiia bacterium]